MIRVAVRVPIAESWRTGATLQLYTDQGSGTVDESAPLLTRRAPVWPSDRGAGGYGEEPYALTAYGVCRPTTSQRGGYGEQPYGLDPGGYGAGTEFCEVTVAVAEGFGSYKFAAEAYDRAGNCQYTALAEVTQLVSGEDPRPAETFEYQEYESGTDQVVFGVAFSGVAVMAIDLPSISADTAAALRTAGLDGNTGIDYIAKGTDDADDPSLSTRLTQQSAQLNWALAAINGGSVISKTPHGAGRTVIVKALARYTLGGVEYTGMADEEFACTDDSTCYLYVDADEVVEESTTGWPATAHIKLAVVTTSSGSITTIEPALTQNFDPDADNQWFNVAALGDVDLNENGLLDVSYLSSSDPTDLTVSSGSITPTGWVHNVAGEGGADDDLTDIAVSGDDTRPWLLLRPKMVGGSASGHVTIKSTGNIVLNDGDYRLSDPPGGINDIPYCILLHQRDATHWEEVCRNHLVLTQLSDALDANVNSIHDLAFLNFTYTIPATISGGVLAAWSTYMAIDTEASAASDDLDSVTGTSTAGTLLIIKPANGARTVVVKHATGTNKFLLANGLDFAMSSTSHTLVCRHNGTQWVEVARSPMAARDLVTSDTDDRCVPYTRDIVLTGALTAKVYEQHLYCPYAFTIQNVTGYADTGPSGGAMYIDVKDDGASIFGANQADWVAIADGTNSDTSTTVDHEVAAGSWITVQVVAPNGAEDLVLTINGLINLQTAA